MHTSYDVIGNMQKVKTCTGDPNAVFAISQSFNKNTVIHLCSRVFMSRCGRDLNQSGDESGEVLKPSEPL